MVEEWIKNVVCIYTVEYPFGHKKILPCVTPQMDLEDIILSKMSQRMTDIISLICGIKTYRGKELIDTEGNRLIVIKNVGWEEGKWVKEGQKGTNFNYKIN